MTTWIHFTEDPRRFTRGLRRIKRTRLDQFVDDGLFVYRYDETVDYPWQPTRQPIFIKCDESVVEFVQSNPFGANKAMDEYMIPVSQFGKCKVYATSD